MSRILTIRQLGNDNVEFVNQNGVKEQILGPSTQWDYDASNNTLFTKGQGGRKYTIRPLGNINLEFNDGSITVFSGNAEQLYNEFMKDGGFFFELGALSRNYNIYKDGYQPFDIIKQNYSTGSAGAGFIRGRLLVVPVNVTIDSLAIDVTVAGAGNLTAGVYSLDISGNPANKLFQAPEFDLSITGLQAKMLSSPYRLKAGVYGISEVSSVAANYVRINPAALINVRFDNFQTEQNTYGNPFAYTSVLPDIHPPVALLSTQIPLVACGIA